MSTATALPQIRTHSKGRLIAYWLITALIAFELVQGALWDFNLVNKGYVYGVLAHLGYPAYLGAILGICKLLAATVFLLPGMLRVKEWAYAGAVILFLGAFTSHTIVGDGLAVSIWSFLFGLLTAASWALRPPGRTLRTQS